MSDAHRLAIDGGPPLAAELLSRDALLSLAPSVGRSVQARRPDRFPYPWLGVWTPFMYDWVAQEGSHELALRVVDRAGTVNDALAVHVEVG